jgi:lamin tail-like protein/CHU domain-containing protein
VLFFFRPLTLAYCLLFITTGLSAQIINRFDVVIDELLPDPSPPVQLPNTEFIELKNVSSTAINIRNWKLSDGSTTATITTNFTLKPDSFVIICSNSAVALYTVYGSAIGVSNFPSLNNDADVISLYAPDGKLIHAVGYNTSWYQNAVKSDGGWTLEMIDTHNPCSGMSNWKTSTENSGGTPGKKNSVDAINKDDLPPALLRTFTTDSITITALFDEPLDSNSAATTSNYIINNIEGHPVSVTPRLPLYTDVVLKLVTPLYNKTVHELKVNNVQDCAGNTIGAFNTTKTGIPVMADSTGIVINEILFNPRSDGYDYIELYNRSNSIIDLKQLYIASRNVTGELTAITPLSQVPYLFFPGEYRAFTENSQWLQQQYLVKDPSLIIQLSSLPSMPDDKGILVVLNQQGSIIDELHYDHNWHFALIDDEAGIALEKINYNFPTQDKSNWTSAASTTGFGTPGYQNSQLMNDVQLQAQVSVMPAVFSPDNDGWNDFATIEYRVNEPGYVANIRIFDANGRRVRYLAQNKTLSATGRFTWDGLDENRYKLPVGIYIVITEIFNLQGKIKKFKQAVTLARKLN